MCKTPWYELMGTTETSGRSLSTAGLTGRHWLGIGAAAVSAVIHLVLGVPALPSGFGVSFVLAAGGFVGAIVLVLFDYRRRTVYAVGIPFTAVQIGLWYWLNYAAGSQSFPADIGPVGAVDKLAQLILIGVLLSLLRTD